MRTRAALALFLMAAGLPSAQAASRPAPAPAMTLQSGAARLGLFASSPGKFGVRVGLGGTAAAAFAQPLPLAVDVVDAQGADTWLTDGYQSASVQKSGLVCAGTLRSAHGSQFHITDMFRALPGAGAFIVSRVVSISAASASDAAFNSRFSLPPRMPSAMASSDFFVPGVWYKSNAHVPPTALASRMDDHFYYFREDRLPLPLATVRDKRTGITLTLAHLGGSPATFAGEDGLARIVDARMQFGALGFVNTDRPTPAFLFPGTEGERTYTFGGSKERNRWAFRSHPVRVDVPHQYQLLIQLSRTPTFPAAVRQSWRTVYALQKPPVIKANLAKVYGDSMSLLAAYTHPYNGVISVPFAVRVPDGTVADTSSEMGFVGQALPSAALLLRYGLETGNAKAVAHANATVDFWVNNSMTPAGLPRTWYDIHPDGTVSFRPYPVFLRIACDGMDGTLRAYDTLRRHGQDRSRWLAYCRRFGNWLTQAQNPDGSWARAFDFSGHRVNPSQDTTDQAIPFLTDLFLVTGDARYRAAALRAGAFCWAAVHESYAYVGGTPDNPNVLDKEGGMMALAAFLSLYDLGHDPRWLQAAAQAAQYCETWVYCWNISMPPGDPKIVFPARRTTVGLSLIAAGQSGADNYMAAAPFLFYRVALLTGDAHLRDAARMLLHDTKQMTDWDGTLGYAHPGLLTEALSLPPLRGHGVTLWLPWLSVAILEPLVRLQEAYGSMDIDQIETLPRSARLARDAQFARTHGFMPPNR